MIISSLMWMGVAVAAPTSVPYSESVGDVQQQGCDPQWGDSCEVGWSGTGASGSLGLMKFVANPTIKAISITPGNASANGIHRIFDASSGSDFEVTASGVAVSGSADLVVRVTFYDAGGATLSSHQSTKHITAQAWAKVHVVRPGAAATARVDVEAMNPSSPQTRMMVASGVFDTSTTVQTPTMDVGTGDNGVTADTGVASPPVDTGVCHTSDTGLAFCGFGAGQASSWASM